MVGVFCREFILDVLTLNNYIPNLSCVNSEFKKHKYPFCKSFNHKTLILPKDICREGNSVELLVLVATRPSSSNLRAAIRSTYGRNQNLVFVVGRDPSNHGDLNKRGNQGDNINHGNQKEENNHQEDENRRLSVENQQHGDILQFDFKEDYYNLTLKSILILNWASQQQCVKYVMKTDDDSYNNIKEIKKNLPEVKKDEIAGFCFRNYPDRNVSSRFYQNYHTYPSDKYLPVYCNGPCYVMSRQAAARIARIAPSVRKVEIEDIFVTGYCRHMAGLKYRQLARFGYTLSRETQCAIRYKATIQIHKVTTREQYRIVHGWMTRSLTSDQMCPLPLKYATVPILVFLCIWAFVMYGILIERA